MINIIILGRTIDTRIIPPLFLQLAFLCGKPPWVQIYIRLPLEAERSARVLNEPPFTRETQVFMALYLRARRTSKRTHRRQKKKKKARKDERLVCYTYIPDTICAIRDLLRSMWERFVTTRDSLSRYNIDFMAPSRAIPGFPVPRCFSFVKDDIDTRKRNWYCEHICSVKRNTECRLDFDVSCARGVSRKSALILIVESCVYFESIFFMREISNATFHY